jgi:hypothetical protein
VRDALASADGAVLPSIDRFRTSDVMPADSSYSTLAGRT